MAYNWDNITQEEYDDLIMKINQRKEADFPGPRRGSRLSGRNMKGSPPPPTPAEARANRLLVDMIRRKKNTTKQQHSLNTARGYTHRKRHKKSRRRQLKSRRSRPRKSRGRRLKQQTRRRQH